MSPAPKALAYGMLTLLEITIVVLVVMSLAAIAALSALGSRKRNYALEDTKALHFIRSANGHSSGLSPECWDKSCRT
jgi:type II secretory pathway pseudopilin PulG